MEYMLSQVGVADNSGDEEEEAPGAVQEADTFLFSQSSQHVIVSVSPGAKSSRCITSRVLVFQLSATCPTWPPIFRLSQLRKAFSPVLFISSHQRRLSWSDICSCLVPCMNKVSQMQALL